MEVILLENVDNLGAVGDKVRVASGYGRNYLIPLKKAVLVTKKNFASLMKQAELKKKKLGKEKEALEAIKEKLDGVVLAFSRKSGENEKLFGSVTHGDIADALKDKSFDVDKKKIHELTPLKTVGEHQVEIKLHPEVTATIMVTIAADTEAE
ncbi:MAG: 50S ribosomal protein L9 [Nitrospinae bacterium]|nr:50S ribosomal protein L9 [Nitrospinota bacterium]